MYTQVTVHSVLFRAGGCSQTLTYTVDNVHTINTVLKGDRVILKREF